MTQVGWRKASTFFSTTSSGVRPKASLPAHGGSLEPQGPPRAHKTDHVRDQRARHERGDPGRIVSCSFETNDGHHDGLSRLCVAHSPELRIALEESILFKEALSFRERMTKIVFETLNVPATYVANQADSFLYAALAPPPMFLRWCGFKVMFPRLRRCSLGVKGSALFISTSRFEQCSSPSTFLP